MVGIFLFVGGGGDWGSCPCVYAPSVFLLSQPRNMEMCFAAGSLVGDVKAKPC